VTDDTVEYERHRVKVEDIFEGPMDLLVHLIQKNEVDIYDIPIEKITAEFLACLEWMKRMNIDVAGDFLVMAATLTQIKSRTLLPPAPRRQGRRKRIPAWRSPGPFWNTCGLNPPPKSWGPETFWAPTPLFGPMRTTGT
jgi:hypothetical protein